MKVDSEALLRPAQVAAGWGRTLPVLGVVLAVIVAIYWPTATSIVAIWQSSQTYAHGFVIVPLALFLAWRKRDEVAGLAPRPDPLGLAGLALASAAWLIAAAGDVQVVQQYAFAAMLPATIVAVAGRRVAWALAFPLAFLFFAVPFGEAYVPRLMDWTADFTVGALRLTGLPVYREGTFFELPSGRWSVVEACSGIRYLIASLTVGTLYAYLTYRVLWKRALFIALSIAVPIFANFARAYLIVMIGHLSSMRLAVGVDHLIYGWIFFGVVILALFWLGSFWRDEMSAAPRRLAYRSAGPRASAPQLAAAALMALALAAASPLYAAYLERGEPDAVALPVPAGAGGWQRSAGALTDWRPRYVGARANVFAVYRKGEHAVALYAGYYRGQRQGAELVGSQNVIVVSTHPVWERVGEAGRREALGGRVLELRQTWLRSPHQRLLVWDWYRVAGRDLANPYLAKALLARERLLQRHDDSAAIILAAPYAVRPEEAQRILREFAADMLPSIESALARAQEASP